MLQQLDTLPDGILDVAATELHTLLSEPTIIHLQGERKEPLFVSVLLHGNETTGLEAIQHLLRDYQGRNLPRSLSIFFGNIEAARHGMRRLDGQPDYNRVWPGGDEPPSAESEIVAEVVEIMRARNLFASVDVHNNTGLNPHYACINKLENKFMHMATLFGRTVVYFIRPTGVQSMAFADICPSVTLECGRVGQRRGEQHAAEYLDALLHLSEFPDHPVAERDIDLFHTVATVKVPDSVHFGFGCDDAELCFVPDLDHLNFRELPAGTEIAKLPLDGHQIPLAVEDEEGRCVEADFFSVEGRLLKTRNPVMPAMLTLDTKIIRQDCLCYLMERLPVG
ncbi:peptidase M14 [Solemya pervernicosa gill symbiont]|uniref:Peptidase M14 n=2 Tax=Gammaproteobacteria incertae sedis TaxID=118884 RepID=A0A1T2L4E6_9GAMM|nr:M14 family metallopeptidase [Candidatus Reidiella endopervernicosa]OOZ39944.1 peptidase M14 [Solemya pervernicosa gill symbiont]QKQ25962.1 succinylglutamate desuccinylase/aspartoacylase family protein [Candidatus Reidiella endopervernicosa]